MYLDSFKNMWGAFVRRAERIELQHPFDVRSRAVYCIVFSAMFLEGTTIALTDFRIDRLTEIAGLLLLCLVTMSGLLARRYGHTHVASMLEGVSLPLILGMQTLIATILLSAASAPFADEILISADRALGFEWLDLLGIYHRYSYLMPISNFVYDSFLLQLILISLLLFAYQKTHEGWRFLTSWAIACTMTSLLFPFFPAIGPNAYFHIDAAEISFFRKTWPWQFGAEIVGIKEGSIRDIGSALAGIVQFPSFHMQAAVMYGWYSRGLRWIAIPVILLNCAMGFSTLISGCHYLVDSIGGALLAVMAIVAGRAIVPDGNE